jgi:hypothetical protein
MRIAKMPHLYYDKRKKRYFVEHRVPEDVQPIIGKVKFKHNFPQSVDHATANTLSVDIVRGWENEWNSKRPGVRVYLPPPPFSLQAIDTAMVMIDADGFTRERVQRAFGRDRIIHLPANDPDIVRDATGRYVFRPDPPPAADKH